MPFYAADRKLPQRFRLVLSSFLQRDGLPFAEALSEDTIQQAFAEAGADCLYAPGVRGKTDVVAMVRALAPKPVNVLALEPGISVSELADLGVRRISVGGALARVAWSAMVTAAEQIKAGSFNGLKSGTTGAQLNGIFGGFALTPRA